MNEMNNVRDRRIVQGWIGSWETAPLEYAKLTSDDIGRTVIYSDYGRAEAGTLSSFRNGNVWARFSTGDTAAACSPGDLQFGIRQIGYHPFEQEAFAK